MKFLFVLITLTLSTISQTYANSQKLVVLGVGEIKNIQTNLKHVDCMGIYGKGVLGESYDVIPGGYRCLIDGECSYAPLFDYDILINDKYRYTYRKVSAFARDISYSGIIINNQCKNDQRVLDTYSSVSSNMMDLLDKIDRGHLTKEVVTDENGNHIESCFLTEALLTVNTSNNVVNHLKTRRVLVPCP